MKIQSAKLTFNKDFNLESEIPVEEVNAYFNDFDECSALKPLTYKGVLVNKGKFIALEVDLNVELDMVCYRCGVSYTRTYAPHISLKLIEVTSVGDVDEIVLTEDDLDTVTFEDGTIDLHAILLESIYLEFDEQNLCSEDCKGICLICKKNLNDGHCSCPK
jgi:uncharacterized protein